MCTLIASLRSHTGSLFTDAASRHNATTMPFCNHSCSYSLLLMHALSLCLAAYNTMPCADPRILRALHRLYMPAMRLHNSQHCRNERGQHPISITSAARNSASPDNPMSSCAQQVHTSHHVPIPWRVKISTKFSKKIFSRIYASFFKNRNQDFSPVFRDTGGIKIKYPEIL